MSVTLANAGSAKPRPETDFYPTPANVTQALCDFLQLEKGTRVQEPAAGQGHMVKCLEKNGLIVTASDIVTGTDFLLQKELACPWIITNPPFYLAEEFIRKCFSFDQKPEGMALLLKSQFWHSSRRLALFHEFVPSYVCPLTWRPDFIAEGGGEAGSPTMEVLWTIWIKGSRQTMYYPLGKPNAQRRFA